MNAENDIKPGMFKQTPHPQALFTPTSLIIYVFRKYFSAISILFWIAGVGAVPAPTLTVTLYTAFPTEFIPSHCPSAVLQKRSIYVSNPATIMTFAATFSAPASTEMDGTTTISLPATTKTDEATNSIPAEVFTENYTLVESSGGFWFSFSSFASGTGNALYETCTFDANGGTSASCIEIDYIASSSGSLQTAATSFEASKTPLVVLPVPTSSSNTAISTS
ncbi:hypothetical protein BT96DRAFT_1007853 [Gymnopus androsaceus JB14]|uniref:Uncharacterized protein n=1 Tax=Gymnopus androsaceus JB14 TaxID=1447944 RepID=A0A6A4GGM0_9AGAR|nr:hypothetical protein BT96DRAFT_1007853 [Gymnopus androsaceus JB14]